MVCKQNSHIWRTAILRLKNPGHAIGVLPIKFRSCGYLGCIPKKPDLFASFALHNTLNTLTPYTLKRVFYSFGQDTLDASQFRCFENVHRQTWDTIEIFCLLDCFGMPHCPPKRAGGGGQQRESCLECCPWELDPDKQNKTDGWMDRLFVRGFSLDYSL